MSARAGYASRSAGKVVCMDKPMGLRVAVTGATGNIGTALVERLASDHGVAAIVGVARRPPDWQPRHTTWVKADVATDDLTATFEGIDVVVHLAWAFQPTHDPMATWKVNAVGSERVFAAAPGGGGGGVIYFPSGGPHSAG